MSYVIQTENLTKTFRKTKAVDNLSLKVPEGSIYAFLGPNGAGKTIKSWFAEMLLVIQISLRLSFSKGGFRLVAVDDFVDFFGQGFHAPLWVFSRSSEVEF